MEQEEMMIVKSKVVVEKCVYAVPCEARPNQKNLVMWVRVEDLPKDFKLDPNARRADVKSKIARQIKETLRDAPENFWKLNGGIQMLARDVDVKDGRQVTLHMFDPEDEDDAGIADGVINGGHTYMCIKEVVEELEADAARAAESERRKEANDRLFALNRAVVRVEVLTGIDKAEMPDISRARNTGEAVRKHSLQNLKGLYEPIKEVLGAEECERVGFCENDVDPVPGRTYQVTELIRLMCLFNNELYPFSADRHPVHCYTSAGSVVEKWDTEAKTFKPLVSKLRDFMELHDSVHLILCAWQKKRRGQRFNGFEAKDDFTLPFTNRKAAFKISSAFVYPILASLRILLNERSEWRDDPKQFIQTSGEALMGVLISFYEEQCKSKPHELGRSIGSWRAVAAETRARFAEQQLRAQHPRSAGE